MKNLKIRIHEVISVCKDSPGVTLTYTDMARILGYIIEVIDSKETIGFKINDELTERKEK